MKTPNARSSGFTLIELLVGLAVLAIIVTVAAPSFTRLMSSQTTAATASRLANAFAYARSEAVTRSDNVTICSSDDGRTCSGNNDWNNGWIVFLDNFDVSSIGSLDTAAGSGEIVLKVEDIDSLGVTLEGEIAFIAFNRLGEHLNSGATVDFDVEGRDDSARTRTISVHRQGSVSVKIN